MNKILKHRLLSFFEDKTLIVLVVSLFIMLNFNVLKNSGLLLAGARSFNYDLKYALLINNFNAITGLFVMIISIYLSSSSLSNEIKSGQIYLTLVSFSKRWKYFLGLWISILMVLIFLLIAAVANLGLLGLVLDIPINSIDTYFCIRDILLNSLSLTGLTMLASIVLTKTSVSVVPLLGLVVHNIYTYSYIPIVGSYIYLGDFLNKIFASIIPIKHVVALSIQHTDYSSFVFVPTLFGWSMNAYQLLYIITMLAVGMVVFSYREI